MPYKDKQKGILYKTWHAMIDRCHNPHSQSFHHYGARGITVCDRWRNSFENFRSDMGDRPDGMSIDRVDNDQGYSPENCRWATGSQQHRNKRKWAFSKKACVNGHEFTEQNSYFYTKGNGENIRACKICMSIKARIKYKSKHPEAGTRSAAADLAR